MATIDTRPIIDHLKQIMREEGVGRLVMVDDGQGGLMLHTVADFMPTCDSAVRTFPGPWFSYPE